MGHITGQSGLKDVEPASARAPLDAHAARACNLTAQTHKCCANARTCCVSMHIRLCCGGDGPLGLVLSKDGPRSVLRPWTRRACSGIQSRVSDVASYRFDRSKAGVAVPRAHSRQVKPRPPELDGMPRPVIKQLPISRPIKRPFSVSCTNFPLNALLFSLRKLFLEYIDICILLILYLHILNV